MCAYHLKMQICVKAQTSCDVTLALSQVAAMYVDKEFLLCDQSRESVRAGCVDSVVKRLNESCSCCCMYMHTIAAEIHFRSDIKLSRAALRIQILLLSCGQASTVCTIQSVLDLCLRCLC